MVESIPDDRWMLKPEVDRAFGILEEEEICFDFLTHPRHLPHVIEVLKKHPGLRAVVDHISKPHIRDRQIHTWAEQMEQIAACKNVYCKLSGMITEADHGNWKPADLKPYILHILRIFGPRRLMFGSDWPVCLLAGSYEQVLNALELNLGGLPAGELAEIFSGTAARFYRLHT